MARREAYGRIAELVHPQPQPQPQRTVKHWWFLTTTARCPSSARSRAGQVGWRDVCKDGSSDDRDSSGCDSCGAQLRNGGLACSETGNLIGPLGGRYPEASMRRRLR